MHQEDHTGARRSASVHASAHNWALSTMPRGEADRPIAFVPVDLDAPIAMRLTARAYPGSHEAGAALDALDAAGMVP